MRGEEVDCLHQRLIGADAVDARIVRVSKPTSRFGSVCVGSADSTWRQSTRQQFARAASGLYVSGSDAHWMHPKSILYP